MPSNESDAAHRQGRDRIIRLADKRLPDHRDRLSDTSNTPGDEPLLPSPAAPTC